MAKTEPRTSSGPPSTQRILTRFAVLTTLLLMGSLFLFWTQQQDAETSRSLIRQLDETTIEFPARVNREGFE